MRDLAKARKILGGALGLLLVLVLMPTPALAMPQMPHQFYGTVTIGEDLTPEGATVSAQIGGKEYASTRVDAEGRYGYSPEYGGTGIFKVPADDPGTPEKEGGVAGETVEFYVLDTLAGQYEFEVFGITELNWVITHQITDLAASKPTQNSIDLTWTTPEAGTRPCYFDARYSEATITSGNWDKATRATGEPAPAAGASQGMKIRGLDSSTTYYFAMKLADKEGFVGLLSNIASATTWATAPDDEIPPAQITGLAANPGSPATTRVILVWTAPGDDEDTGTATSYEIRRSTSPIIEANWSSATIIYNNIVPQAAGGLESFVARITPNRTYYFAIRAKDEVGNPSPTSNFPPMTTAFNLSVITDISPTSGDNSETRTLTIDGDHFVVGGTNAVRFVSGKNTFDLTNVTCASSTQLTAEVPKGAPTGTYKVRVINDNGTSERSQAQYKVTRALTPLPLVTNLIPQMAASNTPVSVRIFGENLAGATGVSFGDTEAISFTVVSDTKITVDMPGLSAGEYDVKVTTPAAGTNEISGVKFMVSDPVAITEDTTEDTTTSEVVELDTNVIPVQLTLTTDTSETATQATDTDAEIEVVIPPQTRVTDREGNAYTGNIHPPRVVKPDESLTDLSDDAVVIEMGDPEKTLNFDKDFVATLIITASVQPVIWYYNKDTQAYELAGKTGTKDGVDYVPGGTKLGQENSTYTIGLLLDHMSPYVAGVQPRITSAPGTVTAGSAFAITGTNFHPTAAEVYFSGTAGTILSRTSTTQILASFPTVGSYTLMVENPDKLSDTTSITLTAPPSVATSAASSVTTTSVTLNGDLGSLGTALSVNVSFEWGTSTAYGNIATVTASPLSAPSVFSSPLSGLASDTTYHFRAKAVGDGTSYGPDSTFTTGTVPIVPPAVTTDPATGVTITLATLNGSLTDLGSASSVAVSFEWGETSAYGNETTPQTMTSTGAFSSPLSGLASDTTYHFRARAAGDGTSYGVDRTFTTGTVPIVPPAVTTDPATGVTTTSATLNGSLTDLGSASSVAVSFEWGETSAYGNETTPQTMTSTGAFSSPLSGLASDTTYHFRARAAGDGTSYGVDRTFTTGMPTVPPAVTTDPATGVTTTSATLNGSLTDLGSASSVAVSFEWGETSAYGNETTPQTMTSTGAFSSPLSGLASDTTYHFRARAAGDGTSYGLDGTFTTIRRKAPPRGGGGGGEPPAQLGTTDVRGKVSTEGVFEEPVTATSEDRLCALTIPEGTVGLTEELEPLTEITMTMDEPPSPPEAAHIVGLAYDFGPDGATFEPAITLTWSYDPADIPAGIAEEDLVIAYYVAGEWIELEGCVVDTENNTITASVEHFTTFALIGTVPPEEEEEVVPPEEEEEVPPEEEEVVPPEEEEEVVTPVEKPAAFTVSQLSISPAEVEVGETVTISVMVANTGDLSGSYEITLRIGGVTVDTKDVTLDGGASRKVTFITSRDVAGTYAISVDGRQGTLVVRTPEPPNWPLIGGIIAGVIVIGLTAFFLVRRRARMLPLRP